MNFNLKKTSQAQAIRWRGLKHLKLLSLLCLVVALVFFFKIVSFKELPQRISFIQNETYLGLSVFFTLFFILFYQLSAFYNYLRNTRQKEPLKKALKNPDKFNFASFLTYKATIVVKKALKKKRREWLLYYLINSDLKEIDFIFSRARLDKKVLKTLIKNELNKVGGKDITDIIKGALFSDKIGTGELLSSFALNDAFFQNFLIKSDFRKEDIYNLACWYEREINRGKEMKKWWKRENLMRRGSVARDLVSSYTINLDKYSSDLREKIKKNAFFEIIGHQEEIKQVERILGKEEINNVLLVGEDGVGKKSLVLALAQKAFKGESVEKVNYKRILEFDLASSGDSLEACLSEALKAGNVILSVYNIQEMKDFNVLQRYLGFANFQIIAVTNYNGLHEVLEKNTSFLNMFEKVEVKEVNIDETLRILENQVGFYEAKHKRYISYKALREIIKLSSRYMTQIPFPEKAIRLLDESIAYLTTYTKDKILEERHIKRIVSEKTEIPLESLEGKEKDLLLNLETLIHQRLINQDEAVKEVSNALRRARAEVNLKKGPIGSFLFLGPTGVGKTECSKTIAEIYFGSEERIIRFDMSEFQNVEDIPRLIGTPKENGVLTTKVKEDPFSLVLLDELEKAHKNVLNLFLQVLDEGFLTDGAGRRVDFKNTIIIATSNAGAVLIREDMKMGKKPEEIKERLLNHLIKQGIYRPEFLNRFDEVVYFEPLSKENLVKIAGLMLNKLKKSLMDKGVTLEITKELKEKIAELSYNPEFGAREMKRVIQDKVENVLAKALLSNQLKRGNKVKVGLDFNLQIQ